MTFEDLLDQVLDMLQRRGRVSYRAMQRQFDLDDATLEDVKAELLYAHPERVADDGRGLVWTGVAGPTPTATPLEVSLLPAASATLVRVPTPDTAPLACTPPHLTEKILAVRPALARCHLGLGRLYGQTGRGAQARVALATAISLYRDMDMTFWLPQAEATLAQVDGQA